MALTKVSPSLFQVSNNITSTTVGGSANTISLTFDSNGVITGASNNALDLSSVTGEFTVSGNGTFNGTGFTKLASGTTAQRPTSNTAGYRRWNTSSNAEEVYVGSGVWANTASKDYLVDYMVIAGGGGGGNSNGGGGGAGGVLRGQTQLSSGTAYPITIGAGGAGTPAPSTAVGTSGSNSTFNSLTAVGGGGGGSGFGPGAHNTAGSGGSGGGGGTNPNTIAVRGTGTDGQGTPGGGGGGSSNWWGGGGGGAGSSGLNGVGTPFGTFGGNGGAGINSDITGTNTGYAGGGGGGTGAQQGYASHRAGDGGQTSPLNGTPASTNSGSGGGGGGYTGSPGAGGSGGSGIVVIAYVGAQRGSGGTITTANGKSIHVFTSPGTFTA